MKAQTPEQLKTLLAEALVQAYLLDDLEAEREPEARQHLVRDLNYNLEALGVSHLAQPRDFDRPGQLVGALADSVAADALLKEHPERVARWAAQRPSKTDRAAEQQAWVEQARHLWGRVRGASQ